MSARAAPPARPARTATQLAEQIRSGKRIPTLGNAVYRTEFVPADRRGAYLGAETQVNVEAGVFNTKKQVAITQEWANVLNDLLSQGGQNSNGFLGPFTADPDARITVEPVTGRTFVPGSPAQLNSGTAFGLAEVRNPAVTWKMGSKLNANRRGTFMRVGGDAYRRVISTTLQGLTALPMEQIDKLILQGYKYGLADLFQSMGIGFSGNRATGLENFDVATIKQYYDAKLKNPDQRRLGSFAAASSARNFANSGKIIDRRTGQPADPAAIVQQFETDGSVRGRYAWAPDVKSGKQRAGLTTHPLRLADGTAIQGAVLDPNAGECNIYGSGPGMGGSGGDDFQLRLYKGKREHRSKSSAKAYGARASADRGMDAPTYYCAPTKAEVIDASRSIYQPGGSRGGNVGLGNALDAIAVNINNPNVSSGALAQRYADWSTTPDNFAPQFQVPLDVPGREGKGGFALFQGARVGRQQGRKLSDQYIEQQSNALLPQQYKAGGRTSARGSAAASPNPFLNM